MLKFVPYLIMILCLVSICLLYLILKPYDDVLFYNQKKYKQLDILIDNWKIIKDDIPYFDMDNKDTNRNRYDLDKVEGDEFLKKYKENDKWIKGWQGNGWYQFPLLCHGKPVGKADQMCSRTINILRQIPGVVIAGYSILLPNSRLPYHTDPAGSKKGTMAVNLFLSGTNSSLYMKNSKDVVQQYKHQLGQLVVFDSNNEHYADNLDSKLARCILYIELETERYNN